MGLPPPSTTCHPQHLCVPLPIPLLTGTWHPGTAACQHVEAWLMGSLGQTEGVPSPLSRGFTAVQHWGSLWQVNPAFEIRSSSICRASLKFSPKLNLDQHLQASLCTLLLSGATSALPHACSIVNASTQSLPKFSSIWQSSSLTCQEYSSRHTP